MNIFSIRDFKTQFSKILRERKEALITYRGKPVGIFAPVKEENLEKEREKIGFSLIGLGEGEGGKISESHDEEIYS